MSENNLEEPDLNIESVNLNPELQPKPVNGNKVPFASEPVNLSGMVSSVLKPQTEKERDRLAKEIEKRQAALNGGKKALDPVKLMISGLVLILVAGSVLVTTSRPIKSKLVAIKQAIVTSVAGVFNSDLKKVKMLTYNAVVFERNFRMVVKTTPIVDKVVLQVGKEPVKKYDSYAGKLLSKDGVSKTWEASANRLKRGKYIYKCYLKNTQTNKFIFFTSAFEIK